jgi:hypothetical protein
MKKQFLTLVAAAALASAAQAQCPNNGTVTHSWTGLGSTESVFDTDNWSTNSVPDCDDNVTFNTGSKDARIPASWDVKNILITSGYKGRVYVENAGTVLTANSLDLSGTIFHFLTNTGHSVFGDMTIGGNGMVNASSNAGITINGTLNLTGAGFFSARFKSTVDLGALTIGAYAQFKAPERGTVNLKGNFAKHRQSSFDHRFGTFTFAGNDLQNYHFSTGSGTNSTYGTCNFWNVVLNKTNNTVNTSDDFTGSDNTDTLVVMNKLTLTDGDFRSGSNVKILDTLDMVGVGAQGHNIAFRMAGTNVADVICNNGTTNTTGNWTLSVEMQNPNRLVKVWSGTADTINLGDGIVNVNTGKLQFDEAVNAAINEPITVTSTGQLVAPSTKRLYIGSYWNLAGRNTFEPRTGEVYITGSGNSSWNHGNSRVFFYDLFIDAPGENHIWGVSANDTIWVMNDLDIIAGSPRSAVVVFEDDVTVHSGADPRMDEFVAHGGEANQDITVASVDQLKTNPIMINKTAGRVRLESDLNLNRLTLKNGNLDPDGFDLTITASNGIIGGNSNSFIRGTVFVQTTSALAGSRMRLPIGVGTKYRPITLHNGSGSNTWEVTFVNSDPSTALGSTLNGTLVSLSADGYWTANRTAGGGGVLSDASYFEISDAGKGAWNDADLRVAKFDGTSAWDNIGGTYTSSAVISTNNTFRSNTNFVIALAEDNSVPQPDILVTGDKVSGNELRTIRTSNGQPAFNNGHVQFGVYPNPASEILFINLIGADKGSITLSDLSGKVIGVYSAETRSIDMSRFAAGVYFATFSNGSERITQRVIRN